jgi:preprotein translocase subunit YajC
MGSLPNIIMLVLIIAIMYFTMIRPQQRKQKELKKLRDSLKQGDRVVTIGGIHGKILEVAESTVLISSDGTKIRFEKSAIASSIEDKADLSLDLKN